MTQKSPRTDAWRTTSQKLPTAVSSHFSGSFFLY
jgi:hypothetical protein